MVTTCPLSVQKGCRKAVADRRNVIQTNPFIKRRFIELIIDYEDFQRLESKNYEHALRDEDFQRPMVGSCSDGIRTNWIMYTKNILELVEKQFMQSMTDGVKFQGDGHPEDQEEHSISTSYLRMVLNHTKK